MTSYFIQNLYLGRGLSEEKMANIPHPRMELHIHVMYKTLQVGSTLGLFIGPVVGAIRGRSMRAFARGAVQGARMGALIGIPAGPLMTELALGMKKANQDSIYDRSYRIRHNRNQITIDRVTTYGTVFGGFASMSMGGTFVTGTVLGIALSHLAGIIYTTGSVPKKEAKQEEAKE